MVVTQMSLWPYALGLPTMGSRASVMEMRTELMCCYGVCPKVYLDVFRVWVSNKVAKSFPLSASRTYTAAFALRQRMLNFIQNIEYYMMFEVIERNWQTFISKMQRVCISTYFFLVSFWSCHSKITSMGKEKESKGGQLVCDGSSQVYGDVCKGLSGPPWPAP